MDAEPRFTGKLRVGWREWVRLPAFGHAEIRAKIDTGARTSALYAHNLAFVRRRGATWAAFDVWSEWPEDASPRRVKAEVVDMRAVTSSNGRAETRPVVATTLVIGGQALEAQVTLANRSRMRFAMLVGRQALGGLVEVDPRSSFLAGRAER